MTEEEWFSCDDPEAMLEWLGSNASERKLRLLAVECCRRCDAVCLVPELIRALDVAELFADKRVAVLKFERSGARVWDVANNYLAVGIGSPDPDSPAWRERMRTGRLYKAVAYAVSVPTADRPSADLAAHSLVLLEEFVDFEFMAQAVLRDVFRYPLRAAVFEPAWRTSTAVALAAQMYASRDFSAMPILADALQDAGCDDDAILRHCREPGEHVRGCWVVDLVLGKE